MTQRRGKLRTKLIIIFALVVAGPLFLTGLLLSLAARTSVQKAGRSLNDISRGSFEEVAGNVSTTVTESLQKAGKQLAQIGHKQLGELGNEQTRQSSEALRVAGKSLVKTGDVLLKQSNNEMIAASNEVVRQSGAKLRATHQQSIDKVSTAMIVQAKDEFTKTGKELAKTTKTEVERLNEDLNEQRAHGLAEYVEVYLRGEVKDVLETARKGVAEADDSLEATAALRDVKLSRVFVNAAASFTLEGKVYAPSADDLSPRDLARWKPIIENTINDKLPHNSQVFQVPVRDSMAITLTLPITGEGGDLRLVLVADILLARIQNNAVVLSTATKTTVTICDASGIVIGHSDPSNKGKEVPGDERQILNEIEKIEQMPDASRPRNTLFFGPDDDRQMCAYVTKIKPFDWTVLVRQPMKTVLATTSRIESAMIKRADVAADRMEKESNRLASQAVDQVRPSQDTIASDAASRLRAANEQALAKAIKRLDAEQKSFTDKAVIQREAAAKNAAETAGHVMDEQATKAIAETTRQVESGTGQSVREGLQRMSRRTAQSASQAARDMMKQSLLLLALFLVFAIAMAVATASSIVRPVYRLAEGAAAIAKGDYAKRVNIASSDEIGELAESFNSMAQAVQQSNEVISLEKSRLQAIVESTPDGLLTEDDGGRLTLLNEATLSLLMLPSHIPLNQQLNRSSLPPEMEDRLDQCVAAAQSQAGVPKDFVVEGTKRHVLQVSSVAVEDEGGRTHGRLIHLHDVTHEREMDQMKTDFVSMVSHELRTPLTSILGFSSYLLTGKLGELNEEQRTALEAMHRQSTRLKAIISDFLDISRIESGSIEMGREHVAIEEIASRVIDELRPSWAEKGLNVSVADNGATPHLAIGDDQRIAQVFTNLLGNAIKFTEPGGNVCVQVGARDREIVVEVVDNGIGIPGDELPKVFDRFYQVEKVVSRKTGGTGLGLAIVKNIVEAHGGQITVHSAMGKGTTFRFTLAAATKKTRSVER